MPAKFFLKAQLANGKSISIEKLSVGHEVSSASFQNGKFELKPSKVKTQSSVFTKEPWLGFKISWKGGHVFCTEDFPLLVNDFQAVPAKLLNQNQHHLITEKGVKIPISQIQNGKVLCGRKTILLDADQSSFDAHVFLINGIWAGDDFMEQQAKDAQEVDYSSDVIFPGNPLIRSLRLLIMRMKGEEVTT